MKQSNLMDTRFRRSPSKILKIHPGQICNLPNPRRIFVTRRERRWNKRRLASAV
jgi:hypothetical protein